MRPECSSWRKIGVDKEVRGGKVWCGFKNTNLFFVKRIRGEEYTQTHTRSLQIRDDNVGRKEGFGVINET